MQEEVADNYESRETWGTSAAPASSAGNGVTDPKTKPADTTRVSGPEPAGTGLG